MHPRVRQRRFRTVIPVSAPDFLPAVARSLLASGYAQTDIVRPYRFAFRTAAGELEHGVADLVAFATVPHTLRSACVCAIDQTHSQVELDNLRYLGAPAVLLKTADKIRLMAVRRDLPFPVVAESSVDGWESNLSPRLGELSPAAIISAKYGGQGTSFVDSG